MAARNVRTGQQQLPSTSFDPAEKLQQSNTLKRHPKMDLNKTDLLRLLSYLEGELQARDVVIATLKAEKAKQLLYQAKYGRFGLGDPFVALQRDSDNMKDHSFDEAAIKCMYDNQLAQLENLIATQRRAQLKMREQLAQVEKRYHKVLSELEEEKQKHAQDTAQGDDVTYMLEKERERLKQEVEFEKNQSRRMEKDLKKTLANLEEERENSAKHKQVALMLIRERRKLVERILQEKRKCSEMEHIMNDEKDKMMNMAEGLVQESKKSLKIEAAMEKQLSDFDTEREQLRGRVSREESKNKELREQVEQLHRELQQARGSVGGTHSSGSSNSSSQLSFISAGDDGVADSMIVGGDDDGFLAENDDSVSNIDDGNVQHSETINLAVSGGGAGVCITPATADAHEQNIECTIPLSSLSSASPSAKVAPHHYPNPVTIDTSATLQISSSTTSSSSSSSPSTALYTSSCYSSSPPTRPPPPPSSSPPPPPQFYTASAVAEGQKSVVQLNSNSSSHAHHSHMNSRPMSPGEIFSPASDIRIVSGVDGTGGSRISVSAAGGATVLSTSGGGRISFQFGQPTSGHPSPPSGSVSTGAGHTRKAVTIGRGTPPPIPPNKPVLIACSSSSGGGGGGVGSGSSGGSGGGSSGTSVVVGVKPAVPPKVGITVSKDRLFLSSSDSDNTVVLSSSSSSSSSSLSSSRTPANKPLQIPVSVVTNQSHIASNRTTSSSSPSLSSSSSSNTTATTTNNTNRENSPMRKTTQVCVNGK